MNGKRARLIRRAKAEALQRRERERSRDAIAEADAEVRRLETPGTRRELRI